MKKIIEMFVPVILFFICILAFTPAYAGGQWNFSIHWIVPVVPAPHYTHQHYNGCGHYNQIGTAHPNVDYFHSLGCNSWGNNCRRLPPQPVIVYHVHHGIQYPVVREYQNYQGQYCREFQKDINIGGRIERGYGTACRQGDGSWRIVR